MNLSRRALLRGLGGVALSLPLLQTLPRVARAQGAFPKRLVVFFNPNGTLKELWSPRGGTETDFALPPLLAPLERHKQDLVIFDGVDMAVADTGPGGPHNRGMATLLTGEIILPGNFADGDGQTAGWAGGPSIDQLLADRLAPPTRFRTLELGVRAIENEPRARISYRGADQPVPPENQPLNVYTRLFAGMNQDPEVMRRLLVQRRSVLDVVREDFARLNAKLAPEDRRKLEQHAESVRQLERSLEAGVATPSGALCRAPEMPPQFDVASEDDFAEIARHQMQLLAMALACDMTRFSTLEFSSALNALRFTFMGLREQDGHSLSHAGDFSAEQQAQWARMNTWYAEQFAYFLDLLRAVPEGDGTLLDNTVVLWCSELSRGNTHSHSDMPFLLAGRAGGAIRTGRHRVFDGVPHNNLLLGLCHAMGADDLQSFGNREFCTGAIDLG